MSTDFAKILSDLAKTNPVFTSERDMQFHLAWQLKMQGYDLHLEHDPDCFSKNAAIDFILVLPERIAVELKYCVLECNHGEIIHKPSPIALTRHGVVKDIERLEAVVDKGKASRGVSILISNNPIIWQKPEGKKSNSDEFSLHDGRALHGMMRWAKESCQNTHETHGPVNLKRHYTCKWVDYVNLRYVDLRKNKGVFRYLITEVIPV
jgi:hypothetical protein